MSLRLLKKLAKLCTSRGVLGWLRQILRQRLGSESVTYSLEGRPSKGSDFSQDRSKDLGRKGERVAYRYLRKHGFRVVARNFTSFSGEIDLVAWDHDILCFLEVKTRMTQEHGRPEEAVTSFKQGQIFRTARDYLRQANLHSVNTRFDIISILYDSPDRPPQCRLIRRAF